MGRREVHGQRAESVLHSKNSDMRRGTGVADWCPVRSCCVRSGSRTIVYATANPSGGITRLGSSR